ncbi:MAG TPA: ABC transporter substrate-binding protein [Candidatus Binatia bacterium]|nr:ABC transporter substrate-binding protein [Candidatus Binatia bacterium]
MKSMQTFVEAGKVVGFLIRVLMVVLILSSARYGETAELKKFTLGYSTVGPAGIGLWMAKEIGAFEKYGIDTELIFVSSGPVVVQALLGGDMKAGLAATNAVTAAVLAGAPLISIMSLINRPYYRCWVQPEITRMDELRGKTLGVSRFGSVTDNLTRILLRRYNLEGAVHIRQMGGTTEMAAAFQRRQIDGAVMATVRVNAPMRMLVDLAELGIRYSNVVIAASRDYYQRNPDIAEGMVRGYLEGVAAVGQQKERALQVIHKYTRLQDPKLLQELYADGVKFLERVPRMDAEALNPIVAFMGKKPIPVESIADNSIVNRLERDGFIDKLYGKR